MRVTLSINECSTDHAGRNRNKPPDHNQRDGPWWQQWQYYQRTLLCAIAEVVVTCTHIVVCPRCVHQDEAAVEVWRRGIQLHAVLGILVNCILVVAILLDKFIQGKTVGLAKMRHKITGACLLEQSGNTSKLVVHDRLVVICAPNLYQVASVRLVCPLAFVSCRVGIASSPLEVNVIPDFYDEGLGNEVILCRGVHLHNISSLSPDVKVEDVRGIGYPGRTSYDVKRIRAILERTAILCRVYRQRQVAPGNHYVRIRANGRVAIVR